MSIFYKIAQLLKKKENNYCVHFFQMLKYFLLFQLIMHMSMFENILYYFILLYLFIYLFCSYIWWH